VRVWVVRWPCGEPWESHADQEGLRLFKRDPERDKEVLVHEGFAVSRTLHSPIYVQEKKDDAQDGKSWRAEGDRQLGGGNITFNSPIRSSKYHKTKSGDVYERQKKRAKRS